LSDEDRLAARGSPVTDSVSVVVSVVVASHTWIDRTTWDPHSSPPTEAPSQADFPWRRMLTARLRDNGGPASPTYAEMRAFSQVARHARLIEAGADRSWFTFGGGFNTKPSLEWPPDMSKPAEPANDSLMIHVHPWREDIDYLTYECLGGCRGKLVVTRSKADGAEAPLAEDAHEDGRRPMKRYAAGWKCHECEHGLWSDVAKRNRGMTT